MNEVQQNHPAGDAAKASESDWADDAQRDLAAIIPRRAPAFPVSIVLGSSLAALVRTTYPAGVSTIAAIILALVLSAWGLWLRKKPRPSVAGFWSASLLSSVAFCGGLVAAMNRENPLEAVVWSLTAVVIVWLVVMSLPWKR